jgi:hypothetical protein
MDGDLKFEINIVSSADNTGFKSAAGASGDLNKGILDSVPALDAAADSSEHLEINHRALHKIMKMIGKQTAPELGGALTGALYGPIGLVLALGYAWQFVQKGFKDYSDDLDKQGAEAAKPAFDAVKNIETAWDDARKKLGEYLAAVADGGKQKDPIDERMKFEKKAGFGNTDAEELAIRNAPGYQASLDFKAKAAGNAAADADAKFKNKQDELDKLRGGEGGKSSGQTKLDALEKLAESMDNIQAHKFSPSDVLAVDAYSAEQQNAGRKGTGRDQLNEDIAAANQQIANEKKRAAQLEAGLTKAAEEKKLADDAAASARALGEHNAQRVKALPGEILSEKMGSLLNDRDAATGASLKEMGGVAHLNQSQIIEIARQLATGQLTHAREIAGLKILVNEAHRHTASLATIGNQ